MPAVVSRANDSASRSDDAEPPSTIAVASSRVCFEHSGPYKVPHVISGHLEELRTASLIGSSPPLITHSVLTLRTLAEALRRRLMPGVVADKAICRGAQLTHCKISPNLMCD